MNAFHAFETTQVYIILCLLEVTKRYTHLHCVYFVKGRKKRFSGENSALYVHTHLKLCRGTNNMIPDGTPLKIVLSVTFWAYIGKFLV